MTDIEATLKALDGYDAQLLSGPGPGTGLPTSVSASSLSRRPSASPSQMSTSMSSGNLAGYSSPLQRTKTWNTGRI